MFFLKGGAMVRVVEQSLSGDLPRSLYLWPLILNMDIYVATLVSTVLTFRKQPYADRFA